MADPLFDMGAVNRTKESSANSGDYQQEQQISIAQYSGRKYFTYMISFHFLNQCNYIDIISKPIFQMDMQVRSGGRVREVGTFLNLLGTSSFHFLPCLLHSCLCHCRGNSPLLGTLGNQRTQVHSFVPAHEHSARMH